MSNNYWLWILPSLCLVAIFGSYANTEYNTQGNTKWYILSVLAGIGLSLLWPCVAKYSTDLVRDNLIWAVTCFVSGMVGLYFKGQFESYTPIQYLGFGLVVSGFILMRK
jgi:FtsH-binding integral membrane protein